MGSSPISVLTFVLLLTSTGGVKEKGRKSKRTSVPQIDCDIRAGKIKVSEFVARCPPGCLGSKQAVWGTDIYASISSVCGAAIHSGVIDNSGGKIHVRKVPSSSSFKGTFSYGVRSLSLPRWRESFVVSGPKQQKGVTYPSILEFLPSRTSRIRTGKLKTTKTPPTTTATTLKPTSSKSPTQQPLHVAHDVTTSKIPEPRTFMLSSPSQQPARSQPMRDEAFRGFPASDFTSRNYPPPRAGVHRQEPAITLHRTGSLGASFGMFGPDTFKTRWTTCFCSARANGELVTDPAYAWTDTETNNKPGYNSKSGLLDYGKWVLSHGESSQRHGQRGSQLWGSSPESFETQSQNTDETMINFWKPDFDREGFSRKDQDIIEDPISQGDPNCKIDLAFLMDGSWSIGRRRFRIQKSFLMKIAQALDIGIAGPLIGIVQFGNNASTEFNLQTYRNSDDLQNAIEKIPQRGGVSNVGRALSHTLGNFFSEQQGNRGGAPNVVVVLVDGWPTDKVEEAARLARESGINIFFITVEGADQSERQDLVERDFVDKAVCRTNGYFSINVPSWFRLYQAVGPLVKRVCDTELLACSKTCLNSADIGFVVDGSSSVGTGNFRTVLQFVANISREFEISDTATRVGVVQYTYEQRLEFGFDKHSAKEALTTAIKDIRYWSGGTSTGEAVSYALKHLFSNSKPNKRKLMIVITDGRSYDDVREPARAAHSNGVIAYAVGIAWAAMDELEYIASDPKKDHSFFVDEFDNLFQFVSRIVHNICQEFNSQPRN
ncbi:vitrin isoform X2 [Chiloscyllium plagiosum]|uniref:vitrin isoform X2 n=1 Tax=Chiloscyllium plagiosum TaxID=36176 RepID=UPI001CB7B233|nr:vitrin isoform X2 [Chiloscyllium plagiosum]